MIKGAGGNRATPGEAGARDGVAQVILESGSRRGENVASALLPTLVERLLTFSPGSAAAEEQQHAIESRLMAALRSGGRLAGEELVASLVLHGYTLERLDAMPCMWRVAIPPPRVLELWFTGGDDPVVAALSYRVGRPWGTKTQRRVAKLQAAFYQRYERLDPQGVLAPDDRLILLVGELEADVSNGGLGQYLSNKGEMRAREALACLSTVGAKRTAQRLESALGTGAEGIALERLNQQFCDKPEDLASLVMTFIRHKD
jgi:hypothetical protein